MNTAPAFRSSALALVWLAGAVLPGAAAPTPAPAHSAPPASRTATILIPAGDYVPFSKTPGDAPHQPVAAFRLDEYPVTNAEFLAFVRAHPQWRRSRVSRLFADSTYLNHWAADLEPGPAAPPDSPVVQVSWFAARAYARALHARLPSTAEWEFAAAAGYTSPDGKHDAQLNRDLYAWFARPSPAVLPSIATAKANFYGVRGLHGLVWEWVDDFNTALVANDSRADSGLDRDLFCAAGAVNVKDTNDYAAFMRQALRSSLKANNTTSSLGFRCAYDAPPPPAP
ncbi:formylglycine-generating enzyme family protein [Horticoccus luteus]|uniref:Formylglycine-generating enzyme family protein n=1 Tax=Horticoccus luteus TaxID=2862869 RepID=A0A8F9TT69_9BACT|nr:formylglycine-generating enzyme family protein [Horticoccus luteus]QYM78779.1 formylglycine-generating enzyme family protein [Horticoccus luteus]